MGETKLELFGIAELAARWGIKKQGAAKRAEKMSKPQRLHCGPVWTLEQVEEFEKNYSGRTRGKMSSGATSDSGSSQ